jgi:putative DNA primase/helicase
MQNTISMAIERVISAYVKKLNDLSDEKGDAKPKRGSDEAIEFKAQMGSIAGTIKNLRRSIEGFAEDKVYRSVIGNAATRFAYDGFADMLDANPYLFGVSNGFLDLSYVLAENVAAGEERGVRLIEGYHSEAISRSSMHTYKKYDPNDQYVATLLSALHDILEEGVFEYIMCYLASSLHGGKKNASLLILDGCGANGKSFIGELMMNTLGTYAVKLPNTIFTERSESSDKANSALMSLRGARFALCSENEEGTRLNAAKTKEITGQETITGRELYGVQQQFKITSNIMFTLNHSPIIEANDPAIWRRILNYKCKTEFTNAPITGHNPRLRKRNDNFMLHYVSDTKWLSGFLSILVHYYEILMIKYNGNLNTIPHDIIRRETIEFRDSQDNVNKFVNSRVTFGDADAKDIALDSLATAYKSWAMTQLSKTDYAKLNVSGIIAKLRMTEVRNHIDDSDRNNVMVRRCNIGE